MPMTRQHQLLRDLRNINHGDTGGVVQQNPVRDDAVQVKALAWINTRGM